MARAGRCRRHRAVRRSAAVGCLASGGAPMKYGKITLHFSSTDGADPRQLARVFGEALIAGASQDGECATAAPAPPPPPPGRSVKGDTPKPRPALLPPLCVDCVHYGTYDGFRWRPDCTAITTFSPVYGNVLIGTPCSIQRSPGKPCGPEGRLFKPHPPSRWQHFKAFFDCPGPL
jgi:hypothetical protein